MSRRIQCTSCKSHARGSWICCDGCESWHHMRCVKVDEEDAEAIDKFYCPECEERGHLTDWYQREPDRHQTSIKRRFYFEVESILEHRDIDEEDERHFLIKWKNYGDDHNSWEPETSLDGCLNLLQKYCRDSNIETSQIVGLLGASGDEEVEHDKRNWQQIERILYGIKQLENCRAYKTDLKVSIWNNDPKDADQVYLVDHDAHCYVVLFKALEKKRVHSG